jgi:hypothetical protein
MACCVFLAFVIAWLLTLRERLAAWRRPAIVGLAIGVAVVAVSLGLGRHRHHLPSWDAAPSSEARP